MAKKNKNNNEPPKKPINEMTDSEFITNADYLASPYYRAYVNARVRAQQGQGQPYPAQRGGYYGYPGYPNNGYQQGGYQGGYQGNPYGYQGGYQGGYPNNGYQRGYQQPAPAPVAPAPAAPEKAEPTSVPKNRRQKKRGLFLFLILLLMLVVVAMTVVYFVNMTMLDQYTSVYQVPDGREIEVVDEETEDVTIEKANAYIDLVDPTIGTVKNFVNDLPLDSFYYEGYVHDKLDESPMMTKIAIFAVPVATTIIIICAVIGLIKALVALCAKRKSDGYYKKIQFGFLSILMFLCALILAIGGLYFSGLGFDGIVEFLTFKSETLQAGYGLYALLGLPILTFIFSCVSYKKIKK